ncbi:hypothetical protein HDU78_000784 [Chytriomyces hyalinus]|nr:hypothetical protein HDU78_000784 [Chytriomyces hyalinus]
MDTSPILALEIEKTKQIEFQTKKGDLALQSLQLIAKMSETLSADHLLRILQLVLPSEAPTPSESRFELMSPAETSAVKDDHFLRWVSERIVATPGKHIHNRTAREDYYQWCENNGINNALTRREFGQKMNAHFPLLDGHKREFKMERVTDAGVRNHTLASKQTTN